MGWLRQSGGGKKEMASLDEKLSWLETMGEPRVGVYRRGWHAHIEMHVASTGAKFEVSSNFGHSSAAESVDELIVRVREAVAKFGGAA